MTDTIQQLDFSVDLLKAILWQYDGATNLKELLVEKAAWYEQNQSQFWTDWIRDVFDLRTANDFGLAVWSIILNQPLFVSKGPDDKPTWGFGEFYVNFTRGNFSSQSGSSHKLGTEAARVLLRLRWYQIIGTSTPPAINRALADVFADYGPAYVLDNLDMTQTYIFKFALSADLIYLFNNFDILPRPASVESDYRVTVNEQWGLGPYRAPFDLSNFSEL